MYLYNYFIALLVVWSLVPFSKGEQPLVENSSLEIKKISLLDLQVEIASFSIYYDQPLYLYDANMCTASNCTDTQELHMDQEDCICNYASLSDCGIVGTTLSNSLPCNCSQSDFCDLYDWTELPLSSVLKTSMKKEEVSLYRFFLPDPCQGVSIRIRRFYGSLKFLLSNSGPATLANSHWQMVDPEVYSIKAYLCPTNPHYVQGTYYMTLLALTDSEFQIEFEEIPIPTIPAPTASTSATIYPVVNNVVQVHNAIENGIPVRGYCPAPSDGDIEKHFYYINMTGCQPVFIYLHPYGVAADIDFYAGFQPAPYFQPEITDPFTPSEFSSYQFGDDYATRVLCPPDSSDQEWTLYVTVDCWKVPQGGNYSLYLTTKHYNLWKKTPLENLIAFEAYYALVDSMKIVSPDGEVVGCDSYHSSCLISWFNLPSEDLVPLHPVPKALWNVPEVGNVFLDIGGNLTLPFTATPNLFQMNVLLSYQIDESPVVTYPREWLSNTTLVPTGAIGNLQGDPLWGITPVSEKPVSCDFAEFQESVKLMQSLFDAFGNATDPNQITSARYKLDSVTFQDGWIGCVMFTEEFVQPQEDQTMVEEVMSQGCFQNPDSEEFDSDPCCSTVAAWFEPCEPRLQNLSSISLKLQSSNVKSSCENPYCVESYLDDYIQLKSDFQNGLCRHSPTASYEQFSSVQTQYITCKGQVYGNPQVCYYDSDCAFASQNFTCNLQTHQCMIPHRVMERTFMECLVNNLTDLQEYYLKNRYGIQQNRSDPAFVDAWLTVISSPDCVTGPSDSIDLTHRTKYLITVPQYECGIIENCQSVECEDSACLYEEQTCHLWCSSGNIGVEIVKIESKESVCIAEHICNWNSTLCEGLTENDCTQSCQNTTTLSFCGLCEDGVHCTEFPTISSEAHCNSTSICLGLTGSVLNLTDYECDEIQSCTHSCGLECVAQNSNYSAGICYSNSFQSMLDCENAGGQWNLAENSTNSHICVAFSQQSQSTCETQGWVWESCSSLSTYQCVRCQNGAECGNFGQILMKCKLSEIPCSDESSCLSSGVCSDSDFLIDTTHPADQWRFYGACVLDRLVPTNNGEYGGISPIPFCQEHQISFPNGCIDYAIGTSEDCVTAGGSWWFPAENQSSCLSWSGCLDLVAYVQQAAQYRFSPKTQNDCLSEYNPYGQWKNYFEWNAGRWIHGVNRDLQWKVRKAEPRFQWNDTLSFPRAREDFYAASSENVALQSKSDALCQYQLLTDKISAVGCDCTDSGSGNCFEQIPDPVVAESRVCSTTSTEVNTAFVTFYPDSESCVDIQFSEISSSRYQTIKQDRLSASFIPTVPVPNYAVYNNKDAVIGILLSDGLQLEVSESIETTEICMKFRHSITSKQKMEYPVLDFATTDSTYRKLIPLELSVYQDSDLVCATLYNITGTQSFFAIKGRIGSYQEVEKKTLDDTSEILAYTLGGFYSVVALLSLLHLVNVGRQHYLKQVFVNLEHALIAFVCLFLTVRAVYFFLVEEIGGSAVADYALVALPTFFYFTAFSIIPVLWAVMTMKQLSQNFEAYKQTIYKILLGVNLFLYVLFLALVVTFEAAKQNETESACPGRYEDGSSDTMKRYVSIVYAAVISALSFVIGLLFLVFGFRLRKVLGHTIAAKKKRQIQLWALTGVCSLSLMLHCVFILIISVLSEPNVYFSFFALLVTEVFPSFYILVHFFRQNQIIVSTTTGTGTVNVQSIKSARTISQRTIKQ